MEKAKTNSLVDIVLDILKDSFVGGQEELRSELAHRGLEVTQSTVSRTLKKLGAVRTYNEDQQPTYSLPGEHSLPPVSATIMELVTGVVANETLVVVTTKPGSASLIARHIDFNADSCIATIAGDDCFIAVPKSIKKIGETVNELKQLLGVEH